MSIEETHVCRICKEVYPYSSFYKMPATGYYNWRCKNCCREYQRNRDNSKTWQKRKETIAKLKADPETKEAYLAGRRKYHHRHKDKYIERTEDLKNIPSMLWDAARRRAREKNLPFNIEVSDIVLPTHCPLLEMPLQVKGGPWSYTLDKIDNDLGYVKGNIQILSRKANTMKNNATRDQLETFAKNILLNKMQ